MEHLSHPSITASHACAMLRRHMALLSSPVLGAGPRAAPGVGAEAWSFACRTLESSAAGIRPPVDILRVLAVGRHPPSSPCSRGARNTPQHDLGRRTPAGQASLTDRGCSYASFSPLPPRDTHRHGQDERCFLQPLTTWSAFQSAPQASFHPFGPAKLSTSASNADRGAADECSRPVLAIYSKAGCCLCDALKEKVEFVVQQEQWQAQQQPDSQGVSGSSPLGYVVADSVESAGSPSPLAGLQVEVRDITSNPDWMQQYEFEIPVMARVRRMPDGSVEEVVIPRQSPRVSADRLKKVLQSVFSS